MSKKEMQPELSLIQRGRNIILTSPVYDEPKTLTIQTKEERDNFKEQAKRLVESYNKSSSKLGKKRIHNKLDKLFEVEKKLSGKISRKTKLKSEIEKVEAVKKSKETVNKSKSVKEAVKTQKSAPKQESNVSRTVRRGERYRTMY